METKYISSESLKNSLSAIIADKSQLLAPVEKREKTDFHPVHSVEEISFKHIQTVQSVKAIAFPRAEKLFSYKKKEGNVEVTEFDEN